VAGDDERLRENPMPPQPDKRATIAGLMAVHHIHALSSDDQGERTRERRQSPEIERDMLESGVGDESSEQRLGPATHEYAVAGRSQTLAEAEDQGRGAGHIPRMSQFEDGERPIRPGD
jgi:hypothetical protein